MSGYNDAYTKDSQRLTAGFDLSCVVLQTQDVPGVDRK